VDPDKLRYLRLSIVEFINDHLPGFVAGEFTDASGNVHRIEDKVPIFTMEMLDQNSKYPQPGSARCALVSVSVDDDGRGLAEITITRPDGLETTSGQVSFVVLKSQLTTTTQN